MISKEKLTNRVRPVNDWTLFELSIRNHDIVIELDQICLILCHKPKIETLLFVHNKEANISIWSIYEMRRDDTEKNASFQSNGRHKNWKPI